MVRATELIEDSINKWERALKDYRMYKDDEEEVSEIINDLVSPCGYCEAFPNCHTCPLYYLKACNASKDTDYLFWRIIKYDNDKEEMIAEMLKIVKDNAHFIENFIKRYELKPIENWLDYLFTEIEKINGVKYTYKVVNSYVDIYENDKYIAWTPRYD